TGDLNPPAPDFRQVSGREINLKARLGIREKMRSKPCLRVAPEQRFHKIVEQRLQVLYRDIFVDIQAFDLMKIRAVGRVSRVAAKTAAGRDNPYRRFLPQH